VRRQHDRQGPPLRGRRKRGTEAQAIGKSRGGRTTKIHAVVDGHGRIIAFELTGGNRHDIKPAPGLIEPLPPAKSLLADTAYDSEAFRDFPTGRGTTPVIKQNPTRKREHPLDKDACKGRNINPAATGVTEARTVDADHGRIETREATISIDVDWLQKDHHWPGLAAIRKVERTPEEPDKTTRETAYYLLSTALSSERFLEVVRSRWGVEKQLHWRLDVVMNEDQQRNRSDNGPHNLTVLRHMALNVMQRDPSVGSLR
jgi:predicted transposase YbfD/YdcC/transposase